ncbi:DUF551 domain-containing protein [Citrobacter freundii]
MTTNRMGLEQTLSDGELTVITDTDHVQCGDAAAMARELLAYRKAGSEPIYQLNDWHWYDAEKHIYDEVTSDGGEGRIVYAVPPLQSVTVPDGWVKCSDRMPYVGKKLALYGRRAKEDCAHYVDEGYLGSNGFFYFFDWEGGPRIDDCHNDDKATVTHWMYWELPAAPHQEVKNV